MICFVLVDGSHLESYTYKNIPQGVTDPDILSSPLSLYIIIIISYIVWAIRETAHAPLSTTDPASLPLIP